MFRMKALLFLTIAFLGASLFFSSQKIKAQPYSSSLPVPPASATPIPTPMPTPIPTPLPTQVPVRSITPIIITPAPATPIVVTPVPVSSVSATPVTGSGSLTILLLAFGFGACIFALHGLKSKSDKI